ncbi:hypothetical protein QJS10_CPA07g00790 [Acorus calamus]|uniref:Uncharacterized protein n=1 Tax=Acorus calamus TaxID=4465 RepID=A0AAV9EG06_ACOCL|nr:hypothetical protein QJS10_CPA07g00790 [Acorus calamus]
MHDGDVLQIIQCDDPKSETFKIGGMPLKITTPEVDIILGIQSGGKEVKVSYGIKPDTPFIRRRFGSVCRPNAPLIKQQLHMALEGSASYDLLDFIRLCCLYLFVGLFYTNSGHTIGWASFQYLKDLKKMRV